MELIDSKYTREKYKELGIEFSDWQKAAIIWHKHMSSQEILNGLRELAAKTADLELRKQIEERINYEEKLLAYIKQNPNNDYVYIIKDKKLGYDYGAFYMFETALERARKYAKEDEEEMCIDKIQIVKDTQMPKGKSYSRWNPNLFPDRLEIEEYCSEYSDGRVGRIGITIDGDINYWWSSEATWEEDMVVDHFDKNRFETTFIKLPYVHKSGMIVKYTPTGEVGVLATGKEDWDKFMKRVDNGCLVGYYDASHLVYSLSEDGYWIHDHISPFFLEEVNMLDEPADEKETMLYQAMKALSEFFSGNQTSEQEQEVLRTTKEYSRVVYEQKVTGDNKKEPKDIWSILH